MREEEEEQQQQQQQQQQSECQGSRPPQAMRTIEGLGWAPSTIYNKATAATGAGPGPTM
eukprot:CAMPEP_0206602210 /NCGR_PEP_ID=MMETSP0325_2-20121206/47224_1 /ASSEMBLY_ACC=CAM_ASM_000347 /TAXON_ID=2866 /ORGANISM="Crypthecodinium cohnii, Strain Seligo" /LENGTH=58 /DNA_ID=CAMNT_0054114599 /DNA_START=60 /DNA_END=236 /DNA_ORIENTATION=-